MARHREECVLFGLFCCVGVVDVEIEISIQCRLRHETCHVCFSFCDTHCELNARRKDLRCSVLMRMAACQARSDSSSAVCLELWRA